MNRFIYMIFGNGYLCVQNDFLISAKNTTGKKLPKKVNKNKISPEENSNVSQYEIFYKSLQNNSVPNGGAFSFDKVKLSIPKIY